MYKKLESISEAKKWKYEPKLKTIILLNKV